MAAVSYADSKHGQPTETRRKRDFYLLSPNLLAVPSPPPTPIPTPSSSCSSSSSWSSAVDLNKTLLKIYVHICIVFAKQRLWLQQVSCV